MGLVKVEWSRAPRSYNFNALGVGPSVTIASVVASTANTSVLAVVPLPISVKIPKVAISFTATTTLGSTNFVNVAYNTLATPNSGGAEGTTAANDNSDTGPSPGGMGIPTNGAVDGNVLFASDIALSTTNFPGATVANGGVNIFVPTNYDAVYPSGQVLVNGVMTLVAGYLTVRAVTAAANTITNLTVCFCLEPVTVREAWQTPGNPQNVCIPGIAW